MEQASKSSLADLTDEQLVERYRRGHEPAFEALVQRYRRELYHFLVRFLGRQGPAEDAFQEAFLQVHLSIDTFDTERRFKPWLFTIAANKARDMLRRTMQRPAAELSAPVMEGDADGPNFVDLMQADLQLPDEQAERAEVQALVREVVEQMPAHLREVLVLAYFHQFSYSQIAEILGIPLGTVKSRLHSAVATFAQQWKARYGP